VVLRWILTGFYKKKLILLRSFLLLAVAFSSFTGWMAALDPSHRLSQYGHTSWKIQDGYFGGLAASITQTTDGYVWVGTAVGVFRFDGVQFVPWTSLSGEQLPSNEVKSVRGAKDGSLWIATGSGLVHWAHDRVDRYLTGEDVHEVIQDEKGQIWATAYRPGDYSHPICRVAGTDVHCYGYGTSEGAPVTPSGPLVEDPSGSLWVGHATGVVRWRPGSIQVYRPKALGSHDGLPNVYALAAAADGSVWVGMSAPGHGGGLQRLVEGVMRPFVVPKLNSETLEVISLLIDRQGTLWVGTQSQGVYRIHGTDVDHFGSMDGLSGDGVNGFFEDGEGTSGSLHRTVSICCATFA